MNAYVRTREQFMANEARQLKHLTRAELLAASKLALDAINATDPGEESCASLYRRAALDELWQRQDAYRAQCRTEVGSRTGENNVETDRATGMRVRAALDIRDFADELLGGDGRWRELRECGE